MNEILKGLSDGTFRAHWANEVLRTPLVTESIKLLLMSIAIEDMDEAGVFSVPRELLAVRVGRGKARISERLQAAVDAGLLVRVSAGKKGSTAVYAAAVKGSACSDLIDHLAKGPTVRTETKFGSDPQDALDEQSNVSVRSAGRFDDETVREAGPNALKKGPAKRDANVERVVGEVASSPTSLDDDFLKIDDAASRPGHKSSKQDQAPTVAKIPFPADFAVTDEMRAWAAERAPLVDIDLETELFINYWLDKPRTKRPGWVRTWQSWMLRQQGWAQQRQPSNVRQLRPTGTDGHRPTSGPRATGPISEEDIW